MQNDKAPEDAGTPHPATCRPYDPALPLISIHIPKCGGVSFLQVLSGWFGPNLYTHYYDREKDQPPPHHELWADTQKSRFKKGICIHGHFNGARGFGVQDYYPEAKQFITILRDPFEQAVSHYFYVRNHPEVAAAHGQDWVNEPGYKLETFLRRRRSYLLHHLPFDPGAENIEQLLKSRFVHIGIVEDMQGSVDSLADKLGFPRVKVEHLNVSERVEDIPPGAREAFVEAHPVEYRIYEFARAQYRE